MPVFLPVLLEELRLPAFLAMRCPLDASETTDESVAEAIASALGHDAAPA